MPQIDEQVEIIYGRYSNLVTKSVKILDKVGNGWLAKTTDGKFCNIHYDFCGKLHTSDLFDAEIDARELAEKKRNRKS